VEYWSLKAEEIYGIHLKILNLYYRLNVVTLKIRPLRERIEDIPFLVKNNIDKEGLA